MSKGVFTPKSKPSVVCLRRNPFDIEQKNKGNEIERCMLYGRYFYHFAMFDDQWTLFVLDSMFKKSFTAYNAFDLRDHFQQMKFHYVPYDYSNGIVYDQDKVMKIRLDHRAKKVRVMTEPFEIPREPDFPFKFVIHTVEILKGGIIFVYTCRIQHIVSQRLYLYKWDTFPDRLNMCKIGIRDAASRLQYVSGQVIEAQKLCVVHMQDKTREYGKLTPLVLYWDSEGVVSPDKFEKIECNDGRPFRTKLRPFNLERKEYTGAWHAHTFSLLVTRFMKKCKDWKTFLFIFDAFAKQWTPLLMPNSLKLIKEPLVSFSNAGNNDDVHLCFYAKNTENTVPKTVFWMPIRTPESLRTLSEASAAQQGYFGLRERMSLLQMRLDKEVNLREEHRRLAEEHKSKTRKHFLEANRLKKEMTQMKKRKICMLPINIMQPVLDDEPNDQFE